MKMCQAFANNGHDVTLFARPGNQRIDIKYIYDQYRVSRQFPICFLQTRLKARGLWGIEYAFKFALYLANSTLPFDILYSRNIYALLACRNKGIPLIFEAHDIPTGTSRRFLEKWLYLSRSFARLVCITEPLKSAYLAMFPCLKQKEVIVAPDGADPIETTKVSNSFPPSRYNHQEARLRVGYAGGLYPGRGIEIIEKLSSMHPECDFYICGGNEVEVNARRRNCTSKNIHYLGHISHAQVPEFLLSCQILLAPYQEKISCNQKGTGNTAKWMSPLKLFEYMASKRPIIASKMNALEDVLTHKKNALLVDAPANVDEWSQSLSLLIKNKSLRDSLAQNAFNDFEAKYTWQIRAGNVIKGVSL